MNKLLIVLSIMAATFASCKNDIDVIAPYKETTVVYGLINAADSVQYIRINKAFLGEGNAETMALIPDSFNYPDILDVTLERTGIVSETINLIRDSSIAMPPGAFANVPNILYRTPAGKLINKTSNYNLTIKNRASGKIVTANAIAVGDIGITSPQVSLGTINVGDTFKYKVKFSPNSDGVIYNLSVDFRYKETDLISGNQTYHKATWVFPNVSRPKGNTTDIEIEFTGDQFFSFVKSNLQEKANISRIFLGLDFIFTIGGEEFATYYQVNQPPTGVVQNIPLYTNIEGGIGIFSSRYTQIVPNKQLDGKGLDSLKGGRFTANLGFQ